MEHNRVYPEALERSLREEFLHLGSTTYLDNVGAPAYPRSIVERASRDLLSGSVISSPHTLSLMQDKIDSIRTKILQFFNTDETQYKLIFTSGATASIKLVADNFDWKKNSTFAYLSESHTSVVGVREIAAERGANVRCLSREDLLKAASSDPTSSPSLLAYPAMSNFCGHKFPTSSERIDNWFVLLDAAALVGTNHLDLSSQCPPAADFICISFYKIFGYPTGLGALLVKNTAFQILNKRYFGGGSVETYLVHTLKHVRRKRVEHQFEDGTLPFQQILALQHGLDFIAQFPQGMKTISQHTFQLASYLYNSMMQLKHGNDQPLVEVCASTDFTDQTKQGSIVNFNLLKPDGSHFGFNAFKRLADMEDIIVRTGCFCNIGGCQKYLGYDDERQWKDFSEGHVCGDDIDLMHERPVGSIRISFGCYSTRNDADKVIGLLKNNFLKKLSTGQQQQHCYEDEEENTAIVRAIYIYPIKSCAPLIVNAWEITSSGFKYDRHWVVMKGEQCLTQKHLKALCLLQPEIDLISGTLTLSYPTMPSLSIPISTTESQSDNLMNVKVCMGKVCNELMEGVDCGGAKVTEWLEEATGEEGLKLVRQIARHSKAAALSLANEAPYLVLNRASAQEISRRILTDYGGGFCDAERVLTQFRGNIVLDGLKPFSEDKWQEIVVGETTRLTIHSKCMRCSMISIDQSSGGDAREIVKTLTYMPERSFCFGVLFNAPFVGGDNILRVGSRVHVN